VSLEFDNHMPGIGLLLDMPLAVCLNVNQLTQRQPRQLGGRCNYIYYCTVFSRLAPLCLTCSMKLVRGSSLLQRTRRM